MDWGPILEWIRELAKNASFQLVLGSLTFLVGYLYARWKASRRVPSVDIRVRKATGPAAARIRPRLMVATFSGYPKPGEMGQEEFRADLDAADLERLPLDENTRGIGQTVKLLHAYPTLERLHLVTTHNRTGVSSIDSVPLLRAYAQKHGIRCEIAADERHCIDMEEDAQITRDAFEFTREILTSLGKRYKPRGGKVLVDVTGGTRTINTGALLACLGPDQDAHLIGVRYDASGERIKGSAFPMVIRLKPEGAHRWR